MISQTSGSIPGPSVYSRVRYLTRRSVVVSGASYPVFAGSVCPQLKVQSMWREALTCPPETGPGELLDSGPMVLTLTHSIGTMIRGRSTQHFPCGRKCVERLGVDCKALTKGSVQIYTRLCLKEAKALGSGHRHISLKHLLRRSGSALAGPLLIAGAWA